MNTTTKVLGYQILNITLYISNKTLSLLNKIFRSDKSRALNESSIIYIKYEFTNI